MTTRLMGDAIHANVAALPPGLPLVAGYDTGTPEIAWTAQDWARFPDAVHVIIDQALGDTPSAEAHAYVFDVETGAFPPGQAAALLDASTAARPAVYVNQSNIVATVQAALASRRWHGDTWLALPGWQPGQPWPPAVVQAIEAGARIVAVQNQLGAGGGLYDLSVVLDPYWPALPPEEATMIKAALYADGRIIIALTGTDSQVYVTEQAVPAGVFSGKTGPVGGPLPFPGPLTLTLGVVAGVPSVFVQSADPEASGNGDVFTSWKQAGQAGQAATWVPWVQVT